MCIIVLLLLVTINEMIDKWDSFSLNIFFCVISIANVFVVILIYALILSILTIDKVVPHHEYNLIVLYENHYKIICCTKTIIVLWKYLN